MNCNSTQSLLDKLLSKIYIEKLGDNPKLDISYIKTVKGFEKFYIEHHNLKEVFVFSNGKGCRCRLRYEGKQRLQKISVEIDGLVISSGWYGTVGMLYRCMDEIDTIAQGCRQLQSDLEKQGKINEIPKNNEISQNSINTTMVQPKIRNRKKVLSLS